MDNIELSKRECLFCGMPLHGRKDKKYCDDNCRNNHHYNLNKDANLLVNKVNNILIHNRSVLMSLCQNTKIIIGRHRLQSAGFDFNYITGLRTTKGNACYKLIYDYAYKVVGEDVLVLKY